MKSKAGRLCTTSGVEGEGAGGEEKRYGGAVEQVYMDEENSDNDYSYVLENPLPAQITPNKYYVHPLRGCTK